MEILDKKNLSERDICTKFITPAIVDDLMALYDALESRLRAGGSAGADGGAVVGSYFLNTDFIFSKKPDFDDFNLFPRS